MNKANERENHQITLYTIGFTKKKAQKFFNLIKAANIERLIDIRLNNVSQLAGFTKKDDLRYFLKEIAGVEYLHYLELVPTKDILDNYKKKLITWADYEEQFNKILENRKIEEKIEKSDLNNACLLCSEPEATKCHRRLVAEYLQSKLGNIIIKHL